MKKRKAAFIVGANGIMGTAMITELHKYNYVTIGTTRQEGETSAEYTLHAPDLHPKSCYKLKDELKQLACDNNLTIDVIVELAAAAWQDAELTQERKEEMCKVNERCPNFWIMEFPNAHHILFSSCAVYGTTGTKGLNFYAKTKRKAEKTIDLWCNKFTIVRPTVIATRFAERASMPMPKTDGFPTPEKVAKTTVYQAIVKNKKLVLPGIQAKALTLLNAISPKLTQSFLKV